MNADRSANEDAAELLRRTGAHRWTYEHAIETLAGDPDLRAEIRKNLDQALKSSAALLSGGAKPVEAAAPGDDSLLTVADVNVLQAVAIQSLSRQIAERSRETAKAITAAVELIEPINVAWTTFCALSIGQSIAELIRATLPTTFKHLDHRNWLTSLGGDQLSGTLAGADELFAIAAAYERLRPKELDSPERMSLVESLQGLGVLEAMSREWEADYIIAVNKGGAIVGDYVGNRLNMDRKQIGLVTFKNSQIDLTSAKAILKDAGDARILIVDDISRTGRTLREVHASLTAQSRAHFQCASLVSAVPDMLGGSSLYGFAAALTNDLDVQLPWATKGKLFVRADRYVLGEAQGFAIMKSQAEAIQQDLALKA